MRTWIYLKTEYILIRKILIGKIYPILFLVRDSDWVFLVISKYNRIVDKNVKTELEFKITRTSASFKKTLNKSGQKAWKPEGGDEKATY